MKIAYSCVVDAKAKLEWQALMLVHSLVRNAGSASGDIKVHCLPGVTAAFHQKMNNLGAQVIEAQPFDTQHPYCNKIVQCFSNIFEEYDRVILTDCDLFFLLPPQLPSLAAFAAKVTDMTNPPLGILRKIYKEAGIQPSDEVPVSCALSNDERTFRSNLNGGLYCVDPQLLHSLGASWRDHARWLSTRIDELGPNKWNVDQIAMALALDDLKINVTLMNPQANFPVHLRRERIETIATSAIGTLHYHSSTTPDGHIKLTGVPDVDRAISRANADIDAIIQADFDNVLFWNLRYAAFPELGSGIGSRGETLQYKRDVLRNVTMAFESGSAIDIGCGDLETTKDLVFQHYTGYDVSASALDIARSKRPDWTFINGSLGENGNESADVALCLDVLIHQRTATDYETLVSRLAAAARQRLIVSGYEAWPAGFASNIVSFHEPLSNSLRRVGLFNEISEVGKYRGLSMFVADKANTGASVHVTDMPIEVFNAVAPLAGRGDLLRLVCDMSRASFGFFTKTSIRAIEYPWILERLIDLKPGTRALDIGAGISPLPIILARRNCLVDTVDHHPLIRDNRTRDKWNEWGYLDYSALSARIRSFHQDITKFRTPARYDAIYSVSVLEHMPRSTWEQTLELASTWLKPGGLLLLTLDLIPGTNHLWNLSEGKMVETEEHHGTMDDLQNSIRRLGLTIQELTVKQGIPYARTDVALLACRLESTSPHHLSGQISARIRRLVRRVRGRP